MDKISVIVPVYNVEKYLARCIDSLIGQTHRELEILLVNDASRDGSLEIMQEYSRRDSRVRCLTRDVNAGVSSSRNRGIEEATGDWIAFCDGDDWYLPNAFERLLDSARREDADYIVCNYQLTYDGGKSPIPVDVTAAIRGDLSVKNVVACGPVSSCCHLFHRRLFEVSGARYPVGVGHSEELPVVPVLAKYAKKIAVVNEPLYCYYQRGGGSASNTRSDVEPEQLRALELMQDALGDEFQSEVVYHATYCLLYGELLRLCKTGADRRLLRERIEKYERMLPNYQNNPYYRNFGSAKRAFLWLERRRLYLGMRALARLHGIMIR